MLVALALFGWEGFFRGYTVHLAVIGDQRGQGAGLLTVPTYVAQLRGEDVLRPMVNIHDLERAASK